VPHVTLVHAVALLAEPKLGSAAVALLESGEVLTRLDEAAGFLHVERDGGQRGFVPSAACAPQATQPPAPIHVQAQSRLYRSPSLDSSLFHNPDQWFMVPAEPLLVISKRGHYLLVQRSDGQRGFVPTNVCMPPQRRNGHDVTRVAQQLTLYRVENTEGTPVVVSPDETLLLLGHAGEFVLVQRDDGRIGYMLAAQQGEPVRDVLVPVGPVDVGWIGLGCMWMLLNWLGVLFVVARVTFFVRGADGYASLAAVLGLAMLLWFSRRRRAARSFAFGLLLAYALLHVLSGGSATGWR
jgi:hypothetical protein